MVSSAGPSFADVFHATSLPSLPLPLLIPGRGAERTIATSSIAAVTLGHAEEWRRLGASKLAQTRSSRCLSLTVYRDEHSNDVEQLLLEASKAFQFQSLTPQRANWRMLSTKELAESITPQPANPATTSFCYTRRAPQARLTPSWKASASWSAPRRGARARSAPTHTRRLSPLAGPLSNCAHLCHGSRRHHRRRRRESPTRGGAFARSRRRRRLDADMARGRSTGGATQRRR